MKKTLPVLMLCLISLMGGWALHYFYPRLKPPIKTKEIQRKELRKTLKLTQGKVSDVASIEEKNMGSYARRYLRFRWQGFSSEAYLLIPHNIKDKMPIVLALPGHHSSKEEIIGKKPSRFGVNYGQQLANAGFCVFAPDIPFSNNMQVEDHVALNLIMAGSSLTGMRVSYLRDLIDYLSSLSFIDTERLGCVGWSMGGALSMYLAAVDTRVKVVAISSYFGTYRNTFMRRRQTTDNYIPGILNFGEMADVACLIAPRPLWIEGREKDSEFPKEAFMQGVKALKNCYKGHEERLTWQLLPGGHSFGGKGIEDWFKRWL
ncbi:MAG: dienelactone hydrolase family protein [Deltaproteobacteria bacterium]|nr:dienelactone hydrolase family protein [Deltaproteobacteria bacterium]